MPKRASVPFVSYRAKHRARRRLAMTTTVYLVRHAAHDLLGRILTGRMPGVHLGQEGRAQAGWLADRLSAEPISAVYTSPLERARETAEPIASLCGVAAQTDERLTDIEFGDWSGRSFEELGRDPRWAEWNASRSTARPPGGETMLDVQARAVGAIGCVVAAHPQTGAVVVSHADVIKAVLAHYLGLALDGIGRFEISPASISTVAIGGWGAKVHAVNEAVAA